VKKLSFSHNNRGFIYEFNMTIAANSADYSKEQFAALIGNKLSIESYEQQLQFITWNAVENDSTLFSTTFMYVSFVLAMH
jgi:hypothetical protein